MCIRDSIDATLPGNETALAGEQNSASGKLASNKRVLQDLQVLEAAGLELALGRTVAICLPNKPCAQLDYDTMSRAISDLSKAGDTTTESVFNLWANLIQPRAEQFSAALIRLNDLLDLVLKVQVALPVGDTVDRITGQVQTCLLYTSPSPRDLSTSRMPSSA